MKLPAAYLALFGLGLAQQTVDKRAFEVASIRATDPNPENTAFIGMSADGARVKYTNITLRDCISGAYRVRDFQITGPAWMTKARFEINATLPPGASMEQIPEMLQALLTERFGLEVRHEMKEQNVYALLVGNGGAKLKEAAVKANDKAQTALGPDGKPRPMMMFANTPLGVTLTAPAASLASLVGLMSRFTARPVIDLTSIEGVYEFQLNFASETGAGLTGMGPRGPDGAPAKTLEPAQSVFDAVKKYGLRLEARKAPVEMIEVVHIEKTPTEN
jgi:uncharacterized protein (TIGR03435 family)